MHSERSRESGLKALILPKEHLADLGWGFIVAWGLIVVFTGTFAENDQSNLGVFWLASMMGTPIGLLALAFADKAFRNSEVIDTMLICALAGMTLGTVLLIVDVTHSEGDSFLMQASGGFVSSLGVSAFTVMWGERYSKMNMQRIERSATYSIMLAFACYALEIALPNTMSLILPILLPAFSAICFKKNQRQGDQDANRDAKLPNKPFSKRVFFVRNLGVAGCTTVASITWMLIQDGETNLGHSLFEASVLSGTAVAVFLVLYLSQHSKSLDLGVLYRWALPLIAAANAFLFLPGENFALAASSIVFAVMPLLNLTTFIYLAEQAKTVDRPFNWLFGMGRFFVEIGFLVGMLIEPAIKAAASLCGNPYAPMALATAALTALIMTSFPYKSGFSREDDRERASIQQSDADVSGDDQRDRQDHRLTFDGRKEEAPLPLPNACALLAEEYKLMKREHEVLIYLAQGYSLPYIRNELYIAQSTIDTHVGHICKKMGIHSREELITIVRSKG